MAFEPPSAEVKRAAVGDLSELAPTLRHAFAADAPEFEQIPQPGPDDWLTVHDEPGQTFDEFKTSRPNQPTQDRHTIYLQPLGNFASGRSPSIEKLREFATAFFAMEAKALPSTALDASKFTSRRNPYTGNMQILTSDVLNFLKAGMPRDAFCVIAITMEDLYPELSWNFVFGQASLRDRVGVYSFARYDLAESDRRPLHLCPVCLRKLQSSIGFDVLERYRALEKVCRANGFADGADWFSSSSLSFQTSKPPSISMTGNPLLANSNAAFAAR
jgi:archaemetzincin